MPPGFSSADFYYLLPELIVTGGALLVLMLDVVLPGRGRRSEESGRGADVWLLWVTLATLAAAAVALPWGGENLTIARGLVAVDPFGLFFKIIFLGSAAITVLMSPRYLTFEGCRPGEYYFLVLCATLGMMFVAAGIDLITIFIGLETMALSFYVLAGYIRPSRRSNEAAVKYFILGAFSLGILLYGMSLLYGLTGTTHLRSIATSLASGGGGPMLLLAVILLVAGLGFKIAAVPFHMWAPDVYEGAPTPITAFLSVGSKAASFAMLMRIFVEGLPAFRVDGLGTLFGEPFGWRAFFYVLSIVTMTVGNVAALTQTNTKRLLAYSSIAHAGYVLIGLVAGPPRGIEAALVYLMVYAFMQLGAFAVVVMLRRRDVIGDELKDLTGLYATHPAAAAAMLIFMLSLGGIPPTAGFMGKLWLFGAAIEAGYVWLAVIGVLNSALSLYYYVRLVVFMWITEREGAVDFRISPAVAAVLVVTVAGTVALGVYPRLLFEFAAASAASLGAASMLGIP
ncbi:MAG TPA: NADH-quinone oxidoreductase subunit N [Vicinamibacterales bacterium]|nr:NADH-quinone oxidoreductase subunit N [Vicinamibacterales bacterium]